MQRGDADVKLNPLSDPPRAGRIQGYLSPDQWTYYGFVPSQRIPFSYTPATPRPPDTPEECGATCAGFLVWAQDPWTLALPTRSGPKCSVTSIRPIPTRAGSPCRGATSCGRPTTSGGGANRTGKASNAAGTSSRPNWPGIGQRRAPSGDPPGPARSRRRTPSAHLVARTRRALAVADGSP